MRRVRRKTLFYGFTGVLCLTAVGAVATAQPRRVAHPVSHPRAGECLQCHQGAAEAVFSPTLSNKCVACHTTDAAGLQKAAMRRSAAQPAPQAEAGPAQEEQPSWPKAEGQGPGMSVPMYYEQTRIGASPNEMVLIPAGEFIRGTNQRLSDEGPQHTVSLPDFHIDKYEVTNLQYQRFIDATQRKSPDHFENRTFPPGKADHPVTFVTWHDAKAYCEWAGKRLPTDQEWEKAARGVDGRTYPWGNVFDINKVNSPVRWTTLKLEGDTTPVGAFEGGVSPYGVYDMSGNVWEWTESWYKAYPGNTRPTENYGEKYKTLKGGSWWDCSFYKCGISAPVYNRSFFMRTTKNNSFGFRCASDRAPATHRSS
ncbi:MAG: formylglycine-generating enzyme family protein [Pseudomonadota bacterium]